MLDRVYTIGWAACLVVLAAGLIRRRAAGSRGGEDVLQRFAWVVLGTAIVNAAVCGVLAGVFGRYEARFIWPVCMAALMLVLARAGPRLERVRPARAAV